MTHISTFLYQKILIIFEHHTYRHCLPSIIIVDILPAYGPKVSESSLYSIFQTRLWNRKCMDQSIPHSTRHHLLSLKDGDRMGGVPIRPTEAVVSGITLLGALYLSAYIAP